jgi:hypothetical protein
MTHLLHYLLKLLGNMERLDAEGTDPVGAAGEVPSE